MDPVEETRRSGRRPRLGFLGLGWIGRHRLKAVAESGLAEIAAIADPVLGQAEEVDMAAPDAERAESLDELLQMDLDGVAIATPSAMHAEQSLRALERGWAVFCQKPLGRTAAETSCVVHAARRANRLLGVDLSYRHIESARRIRELIQGNELGEVYAVELVFHNAYGPDKAWFYERELSGGGCVIDLGIHLVDLALWMLNFPRVGHVSSRLYEKGRPLADPSRGVEDYAAAQLHLETGAIVQLACSWNLPAGCDAVIGGTFYGSNGGAAFRNVNGSFYDFVGERFRGTAREMLCQPPDGWGGRAAVDWAGRLAAGHGYDAEVENLIDVAGALDAIYEHGGFNLKTKR